ncbi:TRAP transporter permease [Alteribacillus sp. YIM 98480]|uniref:TRAP transporter permease n=1 Tax=Alteribacillus sp. YIM 98480 TaxID=2606599 RepID=UPI00131E814F|nr:TRAP transporter permease [Alteribacillus sp. YIM 98480]
MEDKVLGEQQTRTFKGPVLWIITTIALAMSIFHLYTAGFGLMTSLVQRGTHLAFVLCLVFLLYPARKHTLQTKLPYYDVCFSVLGFIVGAYIVVNYESIISRPGNVESWEVFLAVAGVLLILEAVRRTMGFPLVIIGVVFLLYAYIGPYMPGLLEHRGYDTERIAYHLYLTTNGIFSTPFGTSATIIAMFVIFSVFLDKTGAGKTFMDVAFSLTGRFRGGPAKASVVGSSIMGTVTGASVSNVVTTGSFTIPLMKRTGYESRFSGAIEAIASTGGQLLPPVMGAAAFIMADFTGVPYYEIITAALIPAILYYGALFSMVHLEAVKKGMKGLSKAELPSLKTTFIEGFHLMIPLALLIFLLFNRYSPTYSVYYCIILLTILSGVKKKSRLNVKSLISTLDNGAKLVLNVAVACAAAGIIIGVITLTGLGPKISAVLITLSGGSFVLLLIITMIASIILGMGLPTAPCYVLLASLVAPALVDSGMPVLAAHLFIFYYGMLSTITPPVALSAFAASGISGDKPNAVGITAVKIGVAAYIIPFMFAFSPELLMLEGSIIQVIGGALTALIGCIALSCGVLGYLLRSCSIWERVILMMASLVLIYSSLVTDIIGMGMLLGVTLAQWKVRRDDTPINVLNVEK